MYFFVIQEPNGWSYVLTYLKVEQHQVLVNILVHVEQGLIIRFVIKNGIQLYYPYCFFTSKYYKSICR